MHRQRVTFHLVMAGCGVFVALALGSLAYVCSRPQTASVQHREAQAIQQCLQRSRDASRSEIQRRALADSCREMRKQYVHKFGSGGLADGEPS